MTPEEWTNRGAKALAAGNLDKALKAFNSALKLNPNLVAARINRMMIRLARGDFKGGFEDYEARFQRPEMAALLKRANKPRWQGEPLMGSGLHVWTEQGLGDQILTLSALPGTLDQSRSCVVECEARLVPLLTRSFPRAQVVAMTPTGEPAVFAPELTWQAPAYDIVRYLWAGPDHIKSPGAYLRADPDLVAKIRQRYDNAGDGKPVVGLSWMSPKSVRAAAKSLPLTEWHPVLSRDDVTLISLQYGWDGSDKALLERSDVLWDTTVQPLQDIDIWAAQIAAMDLVITVSTTVAHLAGALGVPVLTFVPRPGAGLLWYWFEKRTDSPWYPSMTVLRETVKGWGSAFDTANTRLDTLVAEQ